MLLRAKYQRRVEKRGETLLQCTLCPHNCIIKEGEKGVCKSRVNRGSVLYTLAWNNPCTLVIDPIEKKPIHHFLQRTATLSLAVEGCNLSCLNCQNFTISTGPPKGEPNTLYSPENIVKKALELKVPSISYTYSEPTTFYEYMLAIAKEATNRGVKNILISNGYINPEPLKELSQYIDAANIDLKSFDSHTHLKLTGGRLNPVLESIKVLKEADVWIEITLLMVPGYSDNLEHFTNMCQWLIDQEMKEVPLHISRFFPTHKLSNSSKTSIETMIKAKEIAHSMGLREVILGNI